MVFSDLEDHGYSHPVGLYYPDSPLAHEDRVIWLEGLWLQAYWVALWMVLAGSVVWLLYLHLPQMIKQLTHDYRSRGSRPDEPLEQQGFWRIMAGLFMLSISISLAVLLSAEAGGADPEVLDLSQEPVWQSLFLLANASVWEEVMFRILLIGLPLALVHLLRPSISSEDIDGTVLNTRTPPMENTSDLDQDPQLDGMTNEPVAPLTGNEASIDGDPADGHPTDEIPWYRYLWGGVGEWDRLTIILVAFSSFYFAYAHVGHGWDWFKVPGTFVAGVLFAYFYVRWSLPAAITFHFLFDYLGAFSLMEEAGLFPGWIMLPLLITGLGLLVVLICGLTVMIWLIPTYYRSLKDILASVLRTREASLE